MVCVCVYSQMAEGGENSDCSSNNKGGNNLESQQREVSSPDPEVFEMVL